MGAGSVSMKVKSAEFLEILICLLGDYSADVRAAAAEALGIIGNPVAIAPLRQVASRGYYFSKKQCEERNRHPWRRTGNKGGKCPQADSGGPVYLIGGP